MSRNPFESMTAEALSRRNGIPYKVPLGRPIDLPRAVGFRVVGLPAPKGSKSYKGRRRNGSAIMIESAAEALGPWAERVERAARATGVRLAGPVEVVTDFIMPRPKRPSFPVPAVKPDGDKLTRAVWDALEVGGMIEGDARVVRWSGSKRYAVGDEAPGTYVTVREHR